jgi:nucleotide-binding universal stress UspA family protein
MGQELVSGPGAARSLAMRIQRILYPTDFSTCSQQVLDHALFLARQFDAELHMLNAVILHSDDPGAEGLHFPEGSELLARVMKMSSSEVAQWIADKGHEALRVREVQVRGFAAGSLIIDYAANHEIDLIVMGTHGRRGPARLFLGSVATEVVRHSECPVLTLRESDPPREIEAIERLLVPIDFSRHSIVAVAHARELAARYDAALQLVHVVELQTYPTLYGPAATGFDVNELKQLSFDAMDRVMEQTPGPEVVFDKYVTSGRVASEIAGFAAEYDSDMVVISTHGLAGLERMLTGSTTEQVVRLVDCPVFTVKAFGRSLLDYVPEVDLEAD